jgi:competence protein ComEA
MFKKILAFFAAMSLVAAFAAVDVNKATEAELDGIKGIGPVTSKLITAERKKGEFKNWDDFVTRVKGVGEKNAAKFSAEGLTVGGTAYTGAGAADAKAKVATDAKKTDKPVAEKAKDAGVATKDAAKGAPMTTKDAAKDAKATAAAKPDAKADAKVDAKPDAKADAKTDKKAEAKAKADAKAEAKMANTDGKTKAKADAAKPAASAAK